MPRQLTGGNFVVLFERPGKSTYRYGDLQDMYSGDEPIVIWGPPETPGIISFQKKQRQIVVIQDRLQIEAQLSNPEMVVGDFVRFAKKALRAAANQEVRAYGSNFFFVCPELAGAKQLFGISPKTSSFTCLPEAQVHLTFKKDNLQFVLDVADGTPSTVHVNVHHEEKTTTDELMQRIEGTLKEDWDLAGLLISEVLGA